MQHTSMQAFMVAISPPRAAAPPRGGWLGPVRACSKTPGARRSSGHASCSASALIKLAHGRPQKLSPSSLCTLSAVALHDACVVASVVLKGQRSAFSSHQGQGMCVCAEALMPTAPLLWHKPPPPPPPMPTKGWVRHTPELLLRLCEYKGLAAQWVAALARQRALLCNLQKLLT